MPAGRILAIFVGKPKTYGVTGARNTMDKLWKSSIFKEPVSGRVWLSETNFDGDEQADLNVHGGPNKAVNIYSADHYPLWQAELDLPGFGYGAFGENLVVEGQTEETVCIDDVYQTGEAIVQVSQPRGPCWKIARRWRMRTLTAKVARTGRTGWYVRVLKPGYVEVGNIMKLLERPNPGMTISEANKR